MDAAIALPIVCGSRPSWPSSLVSCLTLSVWSVLAPSSQQSNAGSALSRSGFQVPWEQGVMREGRKRRWGPLRQKACANLLDWAGLAWLCSLSAEREARPGRQLEVARTKTAERTGSIPRRSIQRACMHVGCRREESREKERQMRHLTMKNNRDANTSRLFTCCSLRARERRAIFCTPKSKESRKTLNGRKRKNRTQRNSPERIQGNKKIQITTRILIFSPSANTNAPLQPGGGAMLFSVLFFSISPLEPAPPRFPPMT